MRLGNSSVVYGIDPWKKAVERTKKKLEHDHFDYLFADGTAMLNHYFIRVAFMGAWRKLMPVDSVDTIFNVVEKKLNKQAQIHGKLKLGIPFVLINAIKE